MDKSEVISLAGILRFFKDDANCVSKGEIKFNSDFVLAVHMKGMVIHSSVRASMKDVSYKVQLTVDGSGDVTDSSCECPRGNWLCSHMAATAIWVNKKGLSKTDLPNSWIAKPRSAAKSDTIRIKEHFKRKDDKLFKASGRSVSNEDLIFLRDNLVNCNLKWMLKPEAILNTSNSLEPKNIEISLDIYFRNKTEFKETCKVNPEQIRWVAENTKQQRGSQLWGKLRRLRLTGSNFGHVLSAYDRNQQKNVPYPMSLFKSLRGEYKLDTKDSIIWGQMHEDIAVNAYVKATGNKIEQIGLCLFKCGFLGSTPDGLIITSSGEIGVLEVKCPYKYRDMSIDEIIKLELGTSQAKKGFYLKSDGSMNEKHSYWHQVQGEIHATGVSWADFVVWTLNDMRIIRVTKDDNWESTSIPKLVDFYMDVFLPNCYMKY